MAVGSCSVHINESKKELIPHGSLAFPCAGYQEPYSMDGKREFPWHWHEEMEMIHIKSGALIVRIPGKSFQLKEGDCFVANSNVLHYIAAAPECELQSLVFHPALVAGDQNSVFALRYISPLIQNPCFDGCQLKKEEYPEPVGAFCRAFAALTGEEPGYEFAVREHLSRICLFLCESYRESMAEAGTHERAGNSQDNLRVQAMLHYIHQHYQESVTLSEIASAAALSERECLRCFRRTLQMSPMQYVLRYKVMQGAEFLCGNPDRSIADAAASCGFDSPSHFSKMFRRYYNCTPREYRRRETAQKGERVSCEKSMNNVEKRRNTDGSISESGKCGLCIHSERVVC